MPIPTIIDDNQGQGQSGEVIPAENDPKFINFGGGYFMIVNEDTSQHIGLSSGGTELKQLQIPGGFVHHKITFPYNSNEDVIHETTILSNDSFLTTNKRVKDIYTAEFPEIDLNISDGIRFNYHPEILIWLNLSQNINNNINYDYDIFIPIDTRLLTINIDANSPLYYDISYDSSDPIMATTYVERFIALMMCQLPFTFSTTLNTLYNDACSHKSNVYIKKYIPNSDPEIIAGQSMFNEIGNLQNLKFKIFGLCNAKDVIKNYEDYFPINHNYSDGITIDDLRGYVSNTEIDHGEGPVSYNKIIDIIVATTLEYYNNAKDYNESHPSSMININYDNMTRHYVEKFVGNNVFNKFKNLDSNNCDYDILWYNMVIGNTVGFENAQITGGSLDSFYKRKIYLKVKK